ncbi:cytochrome b [Dichotomicrobium thermohalophilum]|uniref:Cytochrome b n=1 Tax=Dichotomicrobium thermohalophilum TaxID=933063 RepID=A0A397PI89_9HYPH|nr:cytochrome b N-terminal domain-containing protein [Dichotomicrobium thermohalophilum]RIA45391.1 ubiquinol-cytochrome c reductase cytochrome b subunit [Dichotomicrobium thermohalophilum]
MKPETSYQPNTAFERWLDERLPIPRLLHDQITAFPTPRNLNYLWTFGGILTFVLMIQIITGIIAAMHYVPDVEMAFESVERLMRDVNYGWLMRYTHAVGASMFFLAVYIHIFRGLYYGSYKAPREVLWILGVIILILMMATAFMGYSLPWGQMSYWAVTVITNLFSSLDQIIPGLGTTIVQWIWGGFSVGDPTLNRLFSLHYLFPFLIAACVGLHIWALHVPGNNNPTGVAVKDVKKDTVPFHPYITVKDGFALSIFAIIFAYFVFYMPNYLGHADNYIPADPLVTPAHIVPEWYFLPFYAILRAIPDKLGGVIAMFGAIFVLFLIPWLDTSRVRSTSYRPLYRPFFWLLVFTCIALGYLGAKPAEGGYVIAARFFTAYYFIHFLVVMPLIGIIERPKQRPGSIAETIYGPQEGRGAAPEAVPAAPEKR